MSTCCSSQVEGVVRVVDLMIGKAKSNIFLLGQFKLATGVIQCRILVSGLYGIARKTDLNL